MKENEHLITEIFYSLQGETSRIGIPFIFIRLTGCNLRCAYCDTAYAFHGGRVLKTDEILAEIKPYRTKNVLLTGGEPLMQKNTFSLMMALKEKGYEVSIETHGEYPIEKYASHARIIMDIKTPGSKMCRGGYISNLPHLKPTDEIKFVIAEPSDYEWAKNTILNQNFPTQEILISPVIKAANAPGQVEGVNPQWLAEKILEDQLPVRMQIQLHKTIWGNDKRGV